MGEYGSVKCTLLYNHPGTIGLQLQIASRVAAACVFVHYQESIICRANAVHDYTALFTCTPGQAIVQLEPTSKGVNQ